MGDDNLHVGWSRFFSLSIDMVPLSPCYSVTGVTGHARYT